MKKCLKKEREECEKSCPGDFSDEDDLCKEECDNSEDGDEKREPRAYEESEQDEVDNPFQKAADGDGDKPRNKTAKEKKLAEKQKEERKNKEE